MTHFAVLEGGMCVQRPNIATVKATGNLEYL